MEPEIAKKLAKNLSEVLDASVCINQETWYFTHTDKEDFKYQLSCVKSSKVIIQRDFTTESDLIEFVQKKIDEVS